MNADLFKTGLTSVLSVAKDFVTFHVKDNIVRIGGTSETHSIVFEAELDSEYDEAKFVLNMVSAKQLHKSIKGKSVVFDVDYESSSVKIICNKSKSTLAIEAPSVLTFRKLLHYVERDKSTFEIDGGIFGSALTKIRGNMDDKTVGDVRFRGLHMRIEDNAMELMASNGKTMSFTRVPARYDGERKTYVLNSQFDDLSRFMIGQVSINVMEKAMTLIADSGDVRYYMTTVILPVPPVPYEQKVEEVNNIDFNTIEVNRKTLLDTMKSNEFFADVSKKRKIIVSFYNDALQISASNESGETSVTIDGDDVKNSDLTGENTFFLSIDNVIRALNLSSQETVKIKLSRTGLPLVFEDDFVTTIVTSFKQY